VAVVNSNRSVTESRLTRSVAGFQLRAAFQWTVNARNIFMKHTLFLSLAILVVAPLANAEQSVSYPPKNP